MIKKTENKNGYTLLFAVIVASVVLSVGMSILSISRKEFLLSSSARESTKAFYAADTGLECAAYHDGLGKFDPTVPVSIECSQRTKSVTYTNIATEHKFTFDIPNSDDRSCAKVTVIKKDGSTFIESRGYNSGWNGECVLSSPTRVERALRYSY